MTMEEKTNILARGDTRHHGEWHLESCQANNAGVACDDDCAAARALLAGAGVTVTCPDGVSWSSWGRRLMEGISNG